MRKARNIFWVVFVLSSLALCVLLSTYSLNGSSPGPTDPAGSDSDLLIWVPLITAITSLIGVVITSAATLKQSRLESRKTDLELAKMQLEIKEKEIELEKKQRALDELQESDPKDSIDRRA